MASNLGNILALFFAIPLMIFICDVCGLQSAYAQMESIATQISFKIQKTGDINQQTIKDIEDMYKVKFSCDNEGVQSFGNIVTFSISNTYNGLLMLNDLNIQITRSIMIGYID